jgi:hypothetical protein
MCEFHLEGKRNGHSLQSMETINLCNRFWRTASPTQGGSERFASRDLSVHSACSAEPRQKRHTSPVEPRYSFWLALNRCVWT